MPENNYVIIQGLRCPICSVLNVRELSVWRMGSQTVRQLECMNGHHFRDYERNGVHHPIVYRHNALGEPITATATQTVENTGRWTFAPAETISFWDLTNFMAHLKAGIELELNYDLSQYDRATIDNKTSDFFGMHILRYHTVPPCPVCGRIECWEHKPKKRVRAIQKDASIDGNESLVYGSSECSEEFAENFKPSLEFLAKYYKVTEQNSAHVHLLVTDDYTPLPITVANNFWQLVRYFYPGYAWIFGNTPGTFLRRSGYSGFQDLLASPLFDRVGGNRNAVYFGESYIEHGKIIIFNMRIG